MDEAADQGTQWGIAVIGASVGNNTSDMKVASRFATSYALPQLLRCARLHAAAWLHPVAGISLPGSVAADLCPQFSKNTRFVYSLLSTFRKLPRKRETKMPEQIAWRFCQKCEAMFYDGFPNK